MDLIKTYAEAITLELDGALALEEVVHLIEKPKYAEQGDLAFPCFSLAKVLKKSPHRIASELAEKVQHPLFTEVVADGPYVNCFLHQQIVSKEILTNILTEDIAYGSLKFGKGKHITIDFSSPNIAKPFSMGHLRSTVIGHAMANIVEKCGYKAIRINHLGDWGTQFGKLIVAYKCWGDEASVRKEPIKVLLDLYVKFHQEALYDTSLEDEARSWFKALEDDHPEALELWEWFREESLKAFATIYDLLDVHFDFYQGEAYYNGKMDQTIEMLYKQGLIEHSDGAEVVNLEAYDLPPCLIKKSDGATLYATRDLTAAIYRQNKYEFEKALYVVGQEQSLHFKQVFLVLKKLGYPWADQMEHIPFGFILKDGKKMSTRKGKVVLLEEVINEAVLLAEKNILDKNPCLENKTQIAKDVGVGAIIFHDLKNDRQNSVEFSLEEMLRFEGTTGPYVQYTHARACSILEKSTGSASLEIAGLQDKYSWSVIKLLMEFPSITRKSFHQNEPSQIAKYVIDVSQEFNKYYGSVKILMDDEQLQSRLALVKSTIIVLKEGLRLLGLKAPEKM